MLSCILDTQMDRMQLDSTQPLNSCLQALQRRGLAKQGMKGLKIEFSKNGSTNLMNIFDNHVEHPHNMQGPQDLLKPTLQKFLLLWWWNGRYKNHATAIIQDGTWFGCCNTSGPNPDIEVGSDVDFDADDLQSQFGCCLGSARLWAISCFFPMNCLKHHLSHL